jgi:hypothetical protein
MRKDAIRLSSLFLSSLMLLAAINAGEAAANPIYQEPFYFCGETGRSYDAKAATGWTGLKSLRRVGKGGYLKVSSPGSIDEIAAVNSNPAGSENGRLLWNTAARGLVIFTDEVAFDVSQIGTIQYQQRLDGIDHLGKDRDSTAVALLIGDTWYISDQSVEQQVTGRWEDAGFKLADLSFGTSIHFSGVGPAVPLNSGLALPSSGVVRAFGVFLRIVRGRARIDNFVLNDTSPAATSIEAAVPPLSCAPPPLEPPLPAEEDDPSFFCPDAEQGKWRGVAVSDRFHEKLFASIAGRRSASAARDKAAIGLLPFLSRDLRKLSQFSLFDYFELAGEQHGKSSRWPAAAAAVERYLVLAGLSGDGPLFRKFQSKRGYLVEGLCAGDFKKLIAARVKAAGIKKRVKFLSR